MDAIDCINLLFTYLLKFAGRESKLPTIKEIAKRLNPDFKIRVTHHDTKISNILLDESSHGLCVIDLNTVMPVILSATSGI